MAISTRDKPSNPWEQQQSQQKTPGLQRRNANSANNRAAYARTDSKDSSSSESASARSGSSARSKSTAYTSDTSSFDGSAKSKSSVRSKMDAVGMFAKGATMAVTAAVTRARHESKAMKLDTRGSNKKGDLGEKIERANTKSERALTKMAAGKALMQTALSGREKSAQLRKTLDERKAKVQDRKAAEKARSRASAKKFQAYGEGQG